MSCGALHKLIEIHSADATENIFDLIIRSTIKHPYINECNKWIEAISEISDRDRFELLFYASGGSKATDGSEISLKEVNDFLVEYSDTEEVEINLHVYKEFEGGKISIYSIQHFVEYINRAVLSDVLISISRVFKTKLCFEVFSQTPSFGSKTISFRSADIVQSAVTELDDITRHSKLSLFKDNCLAIRHSSIANNLLPSDFYLRNQTNFEPINRFYNTACATLALIFLSNNSEYKSNGLFSYTLYGYKAIACKDIKPEDLSKDFDILHQIYEWAYEGGNSSDKFGLIRNIISIHLDLHGNPKFDKQLKDAILSNYQIYLKGNIQSYLDVKNKIGELLFGFIERTNSIADELLSGLKNNVAIIVTFLLTVVVVNGLKDNGEAVIFSNIYLAVVFVISAISAIWLYMLRKNVINRFNSAAESIKITILANYDRVLLSEEIQESVDPSITANKNSFQKEMSCHSKLWGVILCAFLALYLIGNFIFVTNSVLDAIATWVTHYFGLFLAFFRRIRSG